MPIAVCSATYSECRASNVAYAESQLPNVVAENLLGRILPRHRTLDRMPWKPLSSSCLSQVVSAIMKNRNDPTTVSLIFANQTEEDILVTDHTDIQISDTRCLAVYTRRYTYAMHCLPPMPCLTQCRLLLVRCALQFVLCNLRFA